MNEFITGISLYNIVKKVTPEILTVLNNSLFRGAELHPCIFDSEQTPQLLREKLLLAGIKPLVMHIPYGQPYDISAIDEQERSTAVKEIINLFPLMADAGTNTAVIHASFEPIPDQERSSRLVQARQSCLDLQPFLKTNGFRLAVELLPRSCIGHSCVELTEIISGTDPSLIGVCIDTNHLMENYADLPGIVLTLGNRIFSFHISDYDGVDEKHWVPGKGIIDWLAFSESLDKIGYSGLLICECKFDDDVTPVDRLNLVNEAMDKEFKGYLNLGGKDEL